MSSLQALAQLISTGVAKIESDVTNGRSYPSLDDLYTPESSAIQNQYATEAAPIIAAAHQLIATLTHPSPYIFKAGTASVLSASLAAVNEANVPDILREAGPEGLPVNDIAAVSNMDPMKLERIMRFLAVQHIFKEASPGVFSNNRMSGALCVNKSVKEIKAKPLEKFEKTNGIGAMLEFLGDDMMEPVAHLIQSLTDLDTAKSHEPNKTPFNIANKTDLRFHTWLQQPEKIQALKRVQHGMQSFTGYASEDLSSGGFAWALLPANSLIVDVGGGIGTVSMSLVSHYDHLRFVVQDLSGTISQAQQHWTLNMPEKLASGQVTLQEHDFFDEQPVRNADIFVVRYILHIWPDQYCTKILKRLRDAAQPHTKLVVFDEIIEYLSRDKPRTRDEIDGASKPMAPLPLTPYPEVTAGITHDLDMVMMVCLNSQERTLDHFMELFRSTGWKLERVCRIPSPHPQQLICIPV